MAKQVSGVNLGQVQALWAPSPYPSHTGENGVEPRERTYASDIQGPMDEGGWAAINYQARKAKDYYLSGLILGLEIGALNGGPHHRNAPVKSH